LPEVVQRIIFEAWQSIMSLIYLREGDNSGAWKSNLALVEQLMTSLTAIKVQSTGCQLISLAFAHNA